MLRGIHILLTSPYDQIKLRSTDENVTSPTSNLTRLSNFVQSIIIAVRTYIKLWHLLGYITQSSNYNIMDITFTLWHLRISALLSIIQ